MYSVRDGPRIVVDHSVKKVSEKHHFVFLGAAKYNEKHSQECFLLKVNCIYLPCK